MPYPLSGRLCRIVDITYTKLPQSPPWVVMGVNYYYYTPTVLCFLCVESANFNSRTKSWALLSSPVGAELNIVNSVHTFT